MEFTFRPTLEPKAGTGGSRSLPSQAFLMLGISLLMLLPCFWQEHIQAGDLASHVYNAWLATQIERGLAPGLMLVRPWTNVLTDWALEAGIKIVGAAWAERMVAGGAVLAFFWGAFALVTTVARKRPWLFAPGIAMLSYGLIFDLGFLNFYVSTGICLWIMSLLWEPTRARVLISLPLWALAILAHAMPVAWAAGVLGYLYVFRLLPARRRPLALAAGLAAIAGVLVIGARLSPYTLSVRESADWKSVIGSIGAEQVFLFGAKYWVVLGLLAAGIGPFVERIDRGALLRDPVVHIALLQLAVYALAPAAIQFPQYHSALAYIPQRLSFFNALMVCAMLGGARRRSGVIGLWVLVTAVYFTSLFLHTSTLNAWERNVRAQVEALPSGQTIVAEIADSSHEIDLHFTERACIGRCFSYANYEPATGQFRIRLAGPHPVAAPSMEIVEEISEGRHTLTAAEGPMFSLCQCAAADGGLCLRRLQAGDPVCSVTLPLANWREPEKRRSHLIEFAPR